MCEMILVYINNTAQPKFVINFTNSTSVGLTLYTVFLTPTKVDKYTNDIINVITLLNAVVINGAADTYGFPGHFVYKAIKHFVLYLKKYN